MQGKPVATSTVSAETLLGISGAMIDTTSTPPAASPAPHFAAFWGAPSTADYVIPLERAGARILALAGGSDAIWPSSTGAAQIAARLAAFGRARGRIDPCGGYVIQRIEWRIVLAHCTRITKTVQMPQEEPR